MDGAPLPARPGDERAAERIEAATNHAEIRRQELSAIPGARHLAEQYGLQTVVIAALPEKQPGIRITNPLGARYHRTTPNQVFHDHCLSIYYALGHTHPSSKVVFANSQSSASQIEKSLKRDHRFSMELCPKLGIKPKTQIKPLTRGLVAIELSSETLALDADKLVGTLGGRPSMYEVSSLAGPQPSAQEASARRPVDKDNTPALLDMFRSNKEASATLRALPDGHALQAIAHCAASLLDGLEKALSGKLNTPECKHDLVVANAVSALTRVARALPTLTEDSTRFAAAYSALVEEMHLVLAAVKPYGEEDFKRAAARMLAARAGPTLAAPQIAPPETFLLSSGMDAIATGTEIAKLLTGTRHIASLSNQFSRPEYFETWPLLSLPGFGKSRIRIGTLNPNVPAKNGAQDTISNWNTEKLLEAAQHWLQESKPTARHPAAFVLDTTVEQQRPGGTSDLAMVLGALAPDIEAGRLKIVLCKSYQKYTSLGSVKVMAGAISVVGKDDANMRAATARLKEIENDLGWMGNDESQLLTHFITHAHGSELEMMSRAAKNAAFIHRLLDGSPRRRSIFVHYEEGLPFVSTNIGCEQNWVATRPPQYLVTRKLAQRQVSPRDAFAFLTTTLMAVDPTKLRISAGQEAQAELVEKLYAFAWHSESAVGLTVDDIVRKSHSVASRAMRFVLDHADVMTWAPTALHVLRDRGGDWRTIRQCEDLLADGTQKDLLRIRLGFELNRDFHGHHREISERLRIVGSVFAPRLTGSALHANDIDAMRTALQREEATDTLSDAAVEARFAVNAVASLLAMAGMAFGPEKVNPSDRSTLDSLYRSVFASGLTGVSPSTREHLLCDWARLRAEWLRADAYAWPQAQQGPPVYALIRNVEALIRNARLAPYRETRAKMLVTFPDDAFGRLEPSMQRQLTDTMFGPLDAASRLVLTKELAKMGSFSMLSRCLERFGKDLDRADEGASILLSPTMLSGETGRPEDPQQPLDAESCNELRGQLLHAVLPDGEDLHGFGDRMATWAPFLCVDSATASRLTDIARACETMPIGHFAPRPAHHHALSEHVRMLPEPYRQVMQRYLDERAAPTAWADGLSSSRSTRAAAPSPEERRQGGAEIVG